MYKDTSREQKQRRQRHFDRLSEYLCFTNFEKKGSKFYKMEKAFIIQSFHTIFKKVFS
jgi:hypothetical protein